MTAQSPSIWHQFRDGYLLRQESSTPLGLFRILFGLLVAGELLHYWLSRPFMEVFYFQPEFHFAYPGWPHLPFFNGVPMQIFVAGLVVAFLLLAAGWAYRTMRWVCFLGFAYLFFLERAAFLNHWYLTLLICLLLLWIPANVRFSVDVWRGTREKQLRVPAWMRGSILLLIALVYFLSGIAKLNPDWLTGRTMDLVWQTMEGGIERFPDPGSREIWSAWAIALLELVAAPTLFVRRLRLPVIIVLLAFHFANLVFFSIGFFPIMMIVLTLLFLPFPRGNASEDPPRTAQMPRMAWLLAVFFILQVLIPLRHYRFSHNTLWSEEERLFTWDMFIAFKGGESRFRVFDPETGAERTLDLQAEGLSWGQENKIFKSPDMILQFAHYISREYGENGTSPRVFADVQVGLNGRPMQPFIPPNLDLAAQPRRTWTAYPWVIPMQEAGTQP